MINRPTPSRMNHLLLIAVALFSLSATVTVIAQSKEKQAPGEPGQIESKIEVKPAEPPFVPSKEVIDWLDKLEAQSKLTKSLQGKLKYESINTLTMDKQVRFGKLIYEAGPPAKFAAHFDTLIVDRKAIPQNRWYVFDGVWLVEKLADPDKKQFFKWQVVPPNAPPAAANPLGLGRGPFVVPVTLRKDLVLEKYKVTLAAPDEKIDPKNSVHLVLIPRKGQRINFTKIDVWYDKETLLMQRAATLNASEEQSIINLTEVQLNGTITGDPMNTDEPKERGWEVQITPWEDK